MRYVRAALLATAAIGLITIAAPAFSAQIIMGPDGHYYRLVPVKGPLPGTEPETMAVIPGQATANVPMASNCRLTSFENGEYQPEYTTVCGPE
jgi:hypothetical protein